ncbi:MAG: carboxylate-amine ligase, partial [Halocynthiibacter sp.]
DVSPRLEDTLALAAVTQCLTRMLWRLSRQNQRWRLYDNMLIAENRWRAQRYGISEGLIDFGTLQIVPFKELLGELYTLIQEDAEALGAQSEVLATQRIVNGGTSSDRQRSTYREARKAGRDHDEAMRAVVSHLIEEFHADL